MILPVTPNTVNQATQSDLALALVVLVEGVGATVTSDEAKNIVPAITGVIGAVLLAAVRQDFTEQ
jgi:uncharacterized protein YjeT (DUF2065 family)